MKKIRIFTVLVFIATFISPTMAQAVGIPLSLCEKSTGITPPANGMETEFNNIACGDVAFSIGGRNFFFQAIQSLQNKKDHSYLYTTQLFVQNSAKAWVNLGEAPAPQFSYTHYGDSLSNFVETPQGLILGGLVAMKGIGTCGQGFCKTNFTYGTIKIDAANKVTKFVNSSVSGSNKSPGFPFASGEPNVVNFYQPLGLTWAFGKKAPTGASGKALGKGSSFNFFSIDLLTNKLSPISELTNLANVGDQRGGADITPVGVLDNAAILNIPNNKFLKLTPNGIVSPIDWRGDFGSFTQIKDGIAVSGVNSGGFTSNLIFHLNNNETKTCAVTGSGGPLPADNPDISLEQYGSVKGSPASNTASLTFMLGNGGIENTLSMSSDCSYSFNKIGNDVASNQKYANELVNQVSGSKPKGQTLQLSAPSGKVFDKILGVAYTANGVSTAKSSGPQLLCTLSESKTQTAVTNSFFGKDSGTLQVNPAVFGVECKNQAGEKVKTANENFSLSLHYVAQSAYAGPAPVVNDPSPVAKIWPAECPKVVNTAKKSEPLVTGFHFDGNGGNFVRIASGTTTGVTSPASLVGCYADLDSLSGDDGNPWHIGTINHDKTGYYWLNAAGVKWGLTLSGSVMNTDKANPYYVTGHQFLLKP